jgi:hypothetical protein
MIAGWHTSNYQLVLGPELLRWHWCLVKPFFVWRVCRAIITSPIQTTTSFTTLCIPHAFMPLLSVCHQLLHFEALHLRHLMQI